MATADRKAARATQVIPMMPRITAPLRARRATSSRAPIAPICQIADIKTVMRQDHQIAKDEHCCWCFMCELGGLDAGQRGESDEIAATSTGSRRLTTEPELLFPDRGARG